MKEALTKRGVHWVLGTFIVLVLYVLSTGPVGWSIKNGYIPDRFVVATETLYAPVVWVAPWLDETPATAWLVDWHRSYIAWWWRL